MKKITLYILLILISFCCNNNSEPSEQKNKPDTINIDSILGNDSGHIVPVYLTPLEPIITSTGTEPATKAFYTTFNSEGNRTKSPIWDSVINRNSIIEESGPGTTTKEELRSLDLVSLTTDVNDEGYNIPPNRYALSIKDGRSLKGFIYCDGIHKTIFMGGKDEILRIYDSLQKINSK